MNFIVIIYSNYVFLVGCYDIDELCNNLIVCGIFILMFILTYIHVKSSIYTIFGWRLPHGGAILHHLLGE